MINFKVVRDALNNINYTGVEQLSRVKYSAISPYAEKKIFNVKLLGKDYLIVAEGMELKAIILTGLNTFKAVFEEVDSENGELFYIEVHDFTELSHDWERYDQAGGL